MSMYHCEGFVKEVRITKEGVTFTLEPTTPYLFEKKTDEDKTERLLLFVDDSQKSGSARFVGDKEEALFSVPSEKCDLSAMLIVKANRLKVRVTSNLQPPPIPVEELVVL